MEHGSKRVVFTEFGFDPKVHYPRCLTQAEKARYNSDAVFVGHWEPAYEEKVQVLREEGMSVAVYGPRWSRSKLSDRKNTRPLATEEYLKALSGARIGLGLLSRWNHNESASRSFEIPAIGVFLLGQRTQHHLSYFQEAKEAEFFGSNDELSDKARYYVARSEIREAVARAGRNRCLSSRYTQLERTRDILAAIT